MKLLDFDLARVLRDYPAEAAEIMVKLRGSRSKYKHAKMEELQWSWEYGVWVQALTLVQAFSQEPRESPDMEVRIQDYLSRCDGGLYGKIGPVWAWTVTTPPPPELREYTTKMMQDRVALEENFQPR